MADEARRALGALDSALCSGGGGCDRRKTVELGLNWDWPTRPERNGRGREEMAQQGKGRVA
ncbi:MAG: hypothetical protein ACK528_04160, partial [Alphaproteobacteria bacterium]